jgi:hypothetical protein
MQTNTLTEHELVKNCMEELCRKAGFADTENMVQRDFEFLSESIESKTGILISLSTIKRLLNGQFSRLPQIATLNAIAMFLGYAGWQDFKLSKSPRQSAVVATEIIGQANTHRNNFYYRKIFQYRFLLLGGLLLFAALGLFAGLKLKTSELNNFETAQFYAVKTTSNALPNTVVFKYNIDNVNADSFFIQQSWDKSRRVRIYKKTYTLTDIYYEPGYHVAKLIANDKVIKTQDISIPTDKWFFYAKENIFGREHKYIAANGVKDGCLQLDKTDLVNNGTDIQKENEYIYVYFPTKIESSSDNFIFRCRIKSNELKNNACPHLMCEIFCQRNFMYFVSMPKGCASEMSAQFGDSYLSGKTNDLSALGMNVNSWQNVEITVKNKKATIRINDKEVLATSYTGPCGLITGLGFISNGLPQIDFIDLKTLDGKNIYSNDFGR